MENAFFGLKHIKIPNTVDRAHFLPIHQSSDILIVMR